jgi:hypothetical protein
MYAWSHASSPPPLLQIQPTTAHGNAIIKEIRKTRQTILESKKQADQHIYYTLRRQLSNTPITPTNTALTSAVATPQTNQVLFEEDLLFLDLDLGVSDTSLANPNCHI